MSFNIPFDYNEVKRSNTLVVGTNSVGKTLWSAGLCSNLVAKGWQIIVFDTANIWKKKSDLPYYQTIKTLDTPLKLNDLSTIYELGYLTPNECRELVNKVCWYLWNKQLTNPKKWVLTVFEESELFLSHRGKDTEDIQRWAHCARNVKGRSLFISTDLALLDPSKIRLCEQRAYFRQPTEANALRRFRAYHGKDHTRVAKELEVGEYLYYNQGKLKVVCAPLFVPQTLPRPLPLPKSEPKKPKGLIQTIKDAFKPSTETEEPYDFDREDDMLVEEIDTIEDEEDFIPI